MKKLMIIFYFVLILFKVKAQEQQNIEDLDLLYKSIQRTYSYRDQLKNDTTYAQLYQKIRGELNITDQFVVYQKLAQLIYPLNDNHLGFYHTENSNYHFASLKPQTNFIELDRKLSFAPKNSIEGVYYHDIDQGSGYVLFQYAPEVYYLQSVKTGYLHAILTKNKFGTFDAIQFVGRPRAYQLIRNVKLSNQILIGLPFRKTLDRDFRVLGKVNGNFEYKNISERIGYLRLSSFDSNDENVKKATDFFNEIKPSINQQNLIVDLRNNPGGGFKVSGQFIDYLWKYQGKIYILQNAYTVSNAEQFILNVKARKEITILGEPSRGTITHGNNSDTRIVLPSKRFVFYPTDMNGMARHVVHESIGIIPDIPLDAFSKDWIKQTLSYIK